MTGDYTPDLAALLSADIIISTPEKWDGISRNWHSRSYVTKVHSYVSCVCVSVSVIFYIEIISILKLSTTFSTPAHSDQ